MFSATRIQIGVLLSILLWSAPALFGQQSGSPQISPAALVRETVDRELAANATDVKHLFRSRRQTPKGSQTHLYVETNDAMAGMLIAINDRPLTSQQQQAEKDRLAGLMNNPDMLRKKHLREKEDADRSLRIVKALPDAFRYEYAGTAGSEGDLGKAGDELLRLKFTPNPSYSPPTHVEQVLAGMQGYLLIDPATRRLALIDGTLFRDVTFGWGIIGHLDKGGNFRVQQADVGDGSWEITRMTVNMTGKILFVKSISIIYEESFSDFQRVAGNLSFAKGVELLETQQQKSAQNISQPNRLALRKNSP